MARVPWSVKTDLPVPLEKRLGNTDELSWPLTEQNVSADKIKDGCTHVV